MNGNHVKALKVIATVLGTMAVLAGLMTPTILWFIDRGAKQEAFRQHKIEMVQLKEDLSELKEWQINWPITGELARDKVQDNRLNELARRIGKLENHK